MSKIIFAFNKFYYDLVRDMKTAIATSSSSSSSSSAGSGSGATAGASDLKKAIKKAFSVKEMECRVAFDVYKSKLMSLNLLDLSTPENRALPLLVHVHPGMENDIVCTVGVVLDTVGESILTSYLSLFALIATIEEDDDALLSMTLKAIQAWQSNDVIAFKELSDQILDEDVKARLNQLGLPPSSSSGTTNENENQNKNQTENDFMHTSKIGSLAREIAEDLDLGDVQKPEDILNRGIGDIVGKVSSKLQEKFQNGSIKQDDLMREAMQFMGGGGDMVANMMKMMGQMKGAGGGGFPFPPPGTSTGNTGPPSGGGGDRESNATLERLRKKINSKK